MKYFLFGYFVFIIAFLCQMFFKHSLLKFRLQKKILNSLNSNLKPGFYVINLDFSLMEKTINGNYRIWTHIGGNFTFLNSKDSLGNLIYDKKGNHVGGRIVAHEEAFYNEDLIEFASKIANGYKGE